MLGQMVQFMAERLMESRGAAAPATTRRLRVVRADLNLTHPADPILTRDG